MSAPLVCQIDSMMRLRISATRRCIVAKRDLSTLRELVKSIPPFELGARDLAGNTLLHTAVASANHDAVRLLIKQSTGLRHVIDAENQDGDTPYTLAWDLAQAEVDGEGDAARVTMFVTCAILLEGAEASTNRLRTSFQQRTRLLNEF